MPLNIKDLRFTSSDFQPLGRLRDEHAGDKGNVLPKLTVSGVPSGAKELAVICHDPDAPLAERFYALGPSTASIRRRPIFRMRRRSSVSGRTASATSNITGPQPPPGHGDHHYYFWVYALDTNVEGTPTREEFSRNTPETSSSRTASSASTGTIDGRDSPTQHWINQCTTRDGSF
jgi:Raf kinase inhibitor-like YbhB/YbcL family protein